MSENKQTNQPETKPPLNTSPLGSDIIHETFSQKDISTIPKENNNSPKRD